MANFTCSVSAACELCLAASALAQLRLDPGQRLPQRLDQLLDGVPAGVELAGRAEVRRAHPDLADLEQPLLAGIERLRRQGLEPLGQVAVDQRRLVAGRAGALVGRASLAR